MSPAATGEVPAPLGSPEALTILLLSLNESLSQPSQARREQTAKLEPSPDSPDPCPFIHGQLPDQGRLLPLCRWRN